MRQNKVPVVVPYYWRITLKCKNSSFRLVFTQLITPRILSERG